MGHKIRSYRISVPIFIIEDLFFRKMSYKIEKKSYKIIKKEKDGNATDRPNQGSERHGSSLLISIARPKREHHRSGLLNSIVPNDVILNILNMARLESLMIS